jgi:2-keto-4-pentenoate hydratase
MKMQMNSENAIQQAAERLLAAHASRVPCAPIRDLVDQLDDAGAYSVQERMTVHWQRKGRRLVGRKIALSSKAVQRQMGVDKPTFGALFADMCAAEGVDIAFGGLWQPRLETEIALVIDRPLDRDRHTVLDMIGAVAYALPAFEVVGSRIAGWDVKLSDFVADNSAASMIVLGSRPRKLAEFDIVNCRMKTMRRDELVSSGDGRACCGNPLNALVWLADTLVAHGRPLQAGDVVMTGSLGPMVPVAPGDVFDAEIEGLGRLGVRFAAQ